MITAQTEQQSLDALRAYAMKHNPSLHAALWQPCGVYHRSPYSRRPCPICSGLPAGSDLGAPLPLDLAIVAPQRWVLSQENGYFAATSHDGYHDGYEVAWGFEDTAVSSGWSPDIFAAVRAAVEAK